MIRPARQDPPERAPEPSSSGAPQSAPETLRFPPRDRPTTVRRPQQDAPFDLQGQDKAADERVETKAAKAMEAERMLDAQHREEAIRQARAALAGSAPHPELASVVWEAHEAIAAARDGREDPDRPAYVPIAVESRGILARTPIERVPASVYVAPYNLPERAPNPQLRPLDTLRAAILGIASLAFAFFAIAVVTGGLPAVFDAAASPLAPLAPAALAWPIVALAAVGLSAHAWAPDQRSARRQRAVGWPMLAAVASGTVWCLAARSQIMGLTLVAAVFMLGSAWIALRQLNLLTARTRRERWLTDAPVELMLGWSAFALAWTVSAACGAWGWFPAPVTLWSSLALLACMVPVCVAGMSERGRLFPALAFGWGAVWLMAARLLGGMPDPILMVVAGTGGIVALLTALARRQEIGHTERLALQGLATR